MKLFSLILLFLSLPFGHSLAANQLPYELKGEFNFSGTTNAIFSKRYEPVYAFTEQGKLRLQELRNMGWACEVKPRQTYLCSKANVANQVPLFINEKARRLYNSMTINFEEVTVSPSVISEGESLTQYRIPKEVEFKGKIYPYFDYSISHYAGYDLHKVKWGEGIDRHEFVVEGPNDLKKVEVFSDQEKTYYDIFVIEGDFR